MVSGNKYRRDENLVLKCQTYYRKHPDLANRTIAKDLGIAPTTLRRWCEEVGIYRGRQVKEIDWEPIIPLLHTMRIVDVCEKFGLTQYAVCKKRDELDIHSCHVKSLNEPIAGPYVDLWDNWKRPVDLPKYYRDEPI